MDASSLARQHTYSHADKLVNVCDNMSIHHPHACLGHMLTYRQFLGYLILSTSSLRLETRRTSHPNLIHTPQKASQPGSEIHTELATNHAQSPPIFSIFQYYPHTLPSISASPIHTQQETSVAVHARRSSSSYFFLSFIHCSIYGFILGHKVLIITLCQVTTFN